MAEPLREQIMAAAVARLEGVTVANGYRTDVVRVSRVREFLDQVNELPIVLLLPAYELDEDVYEEATLAGQVDAFLGLEAVLFVQGSDALEPDTALNRLEADVGRALTAWLDPADPAAKGDMTLGLAFVQQVQRATGREGDEWSSQDRGHRAWRAVTFRVHYTYEESEE